jgi:hypothetical protein
MARTGLLLVSMLFALGVSRFAVAAGENIWREIPVPGELSVAVPDGERVIYPGCSGGPVCSTDPATGERRCHAGRRAYSFFARLGDPGRLLVFFDGGGACWDANNCIAHPTYDPEVDETAAALRRADGIFDLDNPDNPFADWTMVFIPYCTGDVHWGSRDTSYVDQDGVLADTPGGEVVIHHRGFDNFLAVREVIAGFYAARGAGPSRMLVAGASAGGYGALLGFPWLREALPQADASLFMDSAAGVVDPGFFAQALSPSGGGEGAWGVAANLPSWIAGADGLLSQPPADFTVANLALVADYYPDSRIGGYTTAWDVVQTQFLRVMRNIDSPDTWSDLTRDDFCRWHLGMEDILGRAASLPNYRFYVGGGLWHTVSSSTGIPNHFYREHSAGAPLVDWLDDMVDGGGGQWDNLNVTPRFNCN